MKWRSNLPGDVREVRKFAWLPVACHNGLTVWLELFTEVQRYEIGIEREGWKCLKRLADR